ncbi:hypothetical protein AABB24_015755, partial [Solanum stoloniferum]
YNLSPSPEHLLHRCPGAAHALCSDLYASCVFSTDAYGRPKFLSHHRPTCSPIPFVRETALDRRKKAPSVTQSSQIDLKRSIFERFFFSFMISLLFPLRVAFLGIQILNS